MSKLSEKILAEPEDAPAPKRSIKEQILAEPADYTPPAEVVRPPPGRARYDYASADIGAQMAAVEIARAQYEHSMAEDGVPEEQARAESWRQATKWMMNRTPPGAVANLREGTEMPTLTGMATHVIAPGVRAIDPHGTPKMEREAQFRDRVAKNDAALGNLATAVDAFHAAWDGTQEKMTAEDFKSAAGDKDWLMQSKDAFAKGARITLGTVSLGLLGDLPTPTRLRAQAALIGDAIDNLSADPDLPKVVSLEGYGELAKRAVVKAGVPDAAAFVGEHIGLLKPREANALRQEAQDARPNEGFDAIAPALIAAENSTDPEDWMRGTEGLLSLAPAQIPDRDAINSPEAPRFRAAIKAHPEAFGGDEWTVVRRRIESNASDDELEIALRQVPLGRLADVQPDMVPALSAITSLAKRRDAARKKWGGATAESLERLVTAAAVTPTVEDGKAIYVESMPGTALRLAGTAFEMLAEADIPTAPTGSALWGVAAIADAAGAKSFADKVRVGRLPTKRGLDVMLSSGAYDDVLNDLGLGPYRPLLGADESSWAARVLADVAMPEFQGLGLAATAERAGLDPSSQASTVLDLVDVAAGFLVPAEEIVAAPAGIVARGALRARAGARAMPKGYKLTGALAKAAPSTWSILNDVPLRDMDGDTAIHHAAVSAFEREAKAGREVVFPKPFWDSFDTAARNIGADPAELRGKFKTLLEYRRARVLENTADMVARASTPAIDVLRKDPQYLRVANELDALVKDGRWTADQAAGALMADEVAAFIAVDQGIYATPEEYFGRVKREVGGTPGVGAYFSEAPGVTPGRSRESVEASPEFKSWFGDSKVVGTDGKPLVVYHGTDYTGRKGGGLTTFAPPKGSHAGSHFGTREAANAKLRQDTLAWGDRGRVEPQSLFPDEHLRDVQARNAPIRRKLEAEAYSIRSAITDRSPQTDLDAMERAINEGRFSEFLEEQDKAKALPTSQESARLAEIDAQLAEMDAEVSSALARARPGENVTPVYLNIRNPIEMKDTNWGDAARIKADNPGIQLRGRTPDDIIENLKRAGYDGIVYRNNVEDPGSTSYVAFTPEQIKSAIGNRGTFDPSDPNILHSTIGGKQTEQGTIQAVVMDRPVVPTFYSGLRRAVENLKQERFSADQLRAALKNAPGVKADEIEWTGLDSFLAEHPRPTKAEVLGWLDENAVVVEEKRLGGSAQEAAEAERAAAEDSLVAFNTRAQREGRTPTPEEVAPLVQRVTEADAKVRALLSKREVVEPAHYANYTLPGGTNYREVLFKVPGEQAYTAPHFGDEGRNLLAHVRLNDRVGPNGEKILHVEEVQSDWHQAGREKGYKPRDPVKLREEYQAERDPERKAMLEAEMSGIHQRPADAPFTKSWHELIMKRVLREAAEGGYDGVSWTTGVQQVKRYEDATRQAVDEVRWRRPTPQDVPAVRLASERVAAARATKQSSEAAFMAALDERPINEPMVTSAMAARAAAEADYADAISQAALAIGYHPRTFRDGVWVDEGGRFDLADPDAAVRLYKRKLEGFAGDVPAGEIEVIGTKNGREVYRETMPPEKVADVLGKGMAAKIAESTEASGSLSGADLTIGGEGMKGFYDRMLPDFLNKYTKKWGGRVGETTVEISPAESGTARNIETIRHIDPEAGDFAEPGDVVDAGTVSYTIPAFYERVHYLPLTPHLRDTILHEGQPLFQKVGNTIHGSIEPVTRSTKVVGYLQRFFKTADFDTLLHENGHLLRFLFGDQWTSELIKHFEHTVDPQGFTVLTRKGEEQAAEALRYYLRSRMQPNGRIRAKLDDITLALRDTWLRFRGQTPNLPVELRAMWDATLRPDLSVRAEAIELADHELAPTSRPTVLVPPHTPAGDVQAVAENRVARAGKSREANKVIADRMRVRQAIGLPEDITEIPADELVGKLVGYLVTEKARQGAQGQDLVPLTLRSVVPRNRLDRIQREVRADLQMALGTPDWTPLIDASAGVINLDAGQASALYGIVTDLVNEPYGRTLPDSVIHWDGSPGAMPLEDWNAIEDHLRDRYAGIGVGRDQRIEAVQGPLMGAFLRTFGEAFLGWDDTGHADDIASSIQRAFVVERTGTEYMAGGIREKYEATVRALGESGKDVLRMVRQATEGPGGAAKAWDTLSRDVLFRHFAPAIDPGQADKLLEWTKAFRGEGDLARQGAVMDLNINDLTDRAKLTDLHTMLQAAGGLTDDERGAILTLLRLRGELNAIGADPLLVADHLARNGPVVTDAVSILDTGVSRRWAAVREQSSELWRCLAGSDDDSVLTELGRASDAGAQPPKDDSFVRLYQHFYRGEWTEMFRLGDERAGLTIRGDKYREGQAVLAMFVRMRAHQIWGDFGKTIYEVGAQLHPDDLSLRAIPKDLRAPNAYVMGSRPGGRDNFAAEVLRQINAEVGWKSSQRKVEGAGGRAKWEAAEAAAAPTGMENLEASAKANEILHQLGWKYGKGDFGGEPVTFHDGSVLLLPVMLRDEVAGIIDRVAKVGVAFADTETAGKGAGLAGGRKDVLGRVTPLAVKDVQAGNLRTAAQVGGAATGGLVGALAGGPIGAVAGALIGRRLGPRIVGTAQDFATTAGREAADVGAGALSAPARLAAGATGAVVGAVGGSIGATVGALLDTFHTSTSLMRVGMTTGLLIPNVSSFVGNLWGAFFQTYQTRGFSGALRAWGTNPRLIGDVTGRLWGDGPMRYRLGSKPHITPSGKIITAEMLTRDFLTHGLDSSFPKAEGAEALIEDVRRSIGTWPRRFLDDPSAAVTEMPRWVQRQLTEAWSSIDNMNRVAVYLDALNEGADIGKAAELARLAAFDYGNLTDFERQVMRRTVLFYSFMRQNIRLFWWTLMNHPSRVFGQLRMANGLQEQFVKDEPYIVFPEYAQGRMVLDFRDAVVEQAGSQQGVATLSPPMPVMDAINLTADMLGLALGDQQAAQELAGRLTPPYQGGIVAAFNIDPWSGRDLSSQVEVPQFLVEGDRMATGGVVVDDFLQVRREAGDENEAYPGAGKYVAGNEKGWWFLRNVYQLPPFGRSMSTLEQIDRAAPFGFNPVSGAVGLLRDYRRAGGGENLDAFFAGPGHAAASTLGGGDTRTPTYFEAPGVADDLAEARPGLTVDEERRRLFGFPTVGIATTEMAADKATSAMMRAATKEGNKARSGEDYK